MDFLNSPILGIIIPLVLIYALLSILVSIILEWYNHFTKERSIVMKTAILEMLRDPLNLDYGHLFYSHPAITGIKALNDRPPEYISAALFADVLIDIVVKQAERRRGLTISLENGKKVYKTTSDAADGEILNRFSQGLDLMNDSPLKDLLKSFAIKSSKWDAENKKYICDYDKLKGLIGAWFDDFMTTTSSFYKKRQHSKQFVIGFLVAVALNVDSLHLIKMLSCDADLRNRLSKEADVLAGHYQNLPDSLKNTPQANTIVLQMYTKDTTGGVNRKIKDTTMVMKGIAHIKDSISKTQLQRADTLYRVLEQLDIPIGWNGASAPLSWVSGKFKKDDKGNDLTSVTDHAYVGKSGVEKYVVQRNAGEGKAVWVYLIGLVISGISLGLGSPFWFQILVKFVNIRKSATKS